MEQTATTWQQEVDAGQRFRFGENWRRFLGTLTPERIERAEASLRRMFGVDSMEGSSFLDAGSGSGLFSLAARRLGARVTSMDFDPESVACTEELRRRYFPNDERWTILRGSVLDDAWMKDLGVFDRVYSWGVLHHTGSMWRAVGNAAERVAPGGEFALALYNDQGFVSNGWRTVKQIYCGSAAGRLAVCAVCIPVFIVAGAGIDLCKGRNPIARYRTVNDRGMTVFYDWFDWFGGLPFETAKPEAVFSFLTQRGFRLGYLTTTNGLGTNEFVFRLSV